jgi:hypothetical protein
MQPLATIPYFQPQFVCDQWDFHVDLEGLIPFWDMKCFSSQGYCNLALDFWIFLVFSTLPTYNLWPMSGDENWKNLDQNSIGYIIWNYDIVQKHFLAFWILNLLSKHVLRASPTVLGMWSCTVKLDQENPMFWLRIIWHVAVAGKGLSSTVHLQKRV